MITAWADDGDPEATPIVLLHSLGSDRTMWEPQVASLRADHRLVRVDFRGHGQAPSPPGPYTIDDLGGDVIDVADELGLDTFHLAGVSMGGQTAMWLAVHHPDRLRSLVAANTAARVGSAENWQARIDAVRTHGLAGICDDVLERFFGPGFAAADPAAYAEAQAAFVRADEGGYAACCAALATADLTDRLGDIAAPTLVIAGEHDVATPPDRAERLHDAIVGSELVVLDGAAHLSNQERPAAFTRMLREHAAEAESTIDQ